MCCSVMWIFFFCKQKTAYERRISDWSSDVCSSDLDIEGGRELDIPDVIAAQADMHQPRNDVRLACTPIKCHALNERGCAVSHPHDGNANFPTAHRQASQSRLCASIGRASRRERVCQHV